MYIHSNSIIMELNEYQKLALQSKDCPENAIYSALGLTEEAGEVAGKLKKNWRDLVYLNAKAYNKTYAGERPPLDINETHWPILADSTRDAIIKEMGDVMWYLACLADNLGVDLEEVAKRNIDKIQKRVATGTIHGSGDDREQTNQ